jgi:ornithine carbamoyltransferase
VSRRHLLSLADLSTDDFEYIVARSRQYATAPARAELPLRGATIGIYFRKTSTRTRTAFAAGALKLGAAIISYGSGDLQENTGETVRDTGRVLCRMLDGFVARTAADPAELHALAEQDRMSVINALTEDEHPTQAFADLCTIWTVLGRIDRVRVLYLGEGNSTASALALAIAHLPGAELQLRTPAGYGVRADKMRSALATAQRTGAVITELHDPDVLPAAVDVVYTTRWQTTGTTKSDPQWRTAFEPFRVGTTLLDRYPGSVFMHDLPAHRGEEVEAEVLDGPRSIAFEQAENKLYSAMAILEWCLHGRS